MGDSSLEEEQRTTSVKRTTQEPALRSFNAFFAPKRGASEDYKETETIFPQGNPARPSRLTSTEYDLLRCGVYREVRG